MPKGSSHGHKTNVFEANKMGILTREISRKAKTKQRYAPEQLEYRQETNEKSRKRNGDKVTRVTGPDEDGIIKKQHYMQGLERIDISPLVIEWPSLFETVRKRQ